ncbi:MAG TPA: pyrrolysine--tRNA(Pyl) ligase large subunit [Candidatus Acidoferrales bacterium]|nr:pyrrolysine--tRNA(Pyl) ligase large subunit [Candidatus Acidoferrales bacterium]
MCGNLADIEFTETQKQRLTDLGGEELDLRFSNAAEREKKFDEIELALVKTNKEHLLKLLKSTRRPMLRQIERELTQALVDAGFTEVVTPSIISREFITRMGITEGHALWRQVFWIDPMRCLRPMLAPNLYHIMRNLRRISTPVSIFEVGSCFRKESKGREHAEEFTMLNVVELAPRSNAIERLKEIVDVSLKSVGTTNYELRKAKSEVYGETIDVVVNDIEVASGATGPHVLDGNWQVIDPWAGVGFGLERLAMIRNPCRNIGHVSRSLSYLDGSSLNVM